MKIHNFKLKFQTSQITHFATPIIVGKILAKLQDKKYQISSSTDKSITFRWDSFKLVWNFQAPYILDEGVFEFTKSEKNRLLIRKMDSINEIRHKADTLWQKNEPVRKAANARRDAIMDTMHSMHDFNVKSTYLFYPYKLKKMNLELLEFRPNREIALWIFI